MREAIIMENIEKQAKAARAALPAAAFNVEALESLSSADLQRVVESRDAWSNTQSRLGAQSLHTFGTVPYEMAWGAEGVAKHIAK